ncbi:MAG: glycosyltransferase, partial [Candidatus Babeliales bacterium]|nr:glycosyltransferase [Candidatus Babeliales bacterium]
TDLRKKLAPARIPADQVSITGFPIRQDFFETKDISTLKKQFNVPEVKPVILLLMGSVGSDTLYSFSLELAKLPIAAHIIICTGRYEAIKNKIETIPFPAHISRTVVGFTQKISDLMAIADLLITKAGPVSMSEAMYMNLPMLVDTTTSVLKWEKMNYQFIQKYEFGDVIKKADQISSMVTAILQNGKLQRMKDNLTAYDKKHGSNEVKSLIATMI